MATDEEGVGRIFVLVGPSGSGSNTLMKEALARVPGMRQVATMTTRVRRPGEQEGREHHFVSHEEFTSLMEAGGLIEWQAVHSDLYGTPRQPIDDAITRRVDLITDIEVLGASVLRQAYPDNVILIFVAPPSLEILEERIRARGNITPESMARRLERAVFEMQFAQQCDYVIINLDVVQAVEQLITVIQSERSRQRVGELVARGGVVQWASWHVASQEYKQVLRQVLLELPGSEILSALKSHEPIGGLSQHAGIIGPGLDYNYSNFYNAAVTKEKAGTGRINFEADTETLFVLDEFYVALHSLIVLHDPEPDYMGISNKDEIDQVIEECVARLPEEGRQDYVDEATAVRAMLDEKRYSEARNYINGKSQRVGDLMSDGREPPERIKEMLARLDVLTT